MHVVITGASGNVGTALVRLLAGEPRVERITGIARRAPGLELPKTTWAAADVGEDDLAPLFAGADAVVHLAWLIQPSRDRATTRHANVEGSRRVFHAAAEAGVGALVHASSVGAYSPGPKDRRVDESWPTDGVRSSFYSADKADVESILDDVELQNPGMRVVRLRKGLVFQRDAAEEIRRLFVGPFLPNALVRPGLLPVMPRIPGVLVQAVHADDAADAYRLALLSPDARGPYNVATEPVLGEDFLARAFRAVPVTVPTAVVRRVVDLTWRARLQPTPAGWLDLATHVPLMDTGRARRELGWEPLRDAWAALEDLLGGMRDGAGTDTPPLEKRAGGPLRLRELLSGVGARPGVR